MNEWKYVKLSKSHRKTYVLRKRNREEEVKGGEREKEKVNIVHGRQGRKIFCLFPLMCLFYFYFRLMNV